MITNCMLSASITSNVWLQQRNAQKNSFHFIYDAILVRSSTYNNFNSDLNYLYVVYSEICVQNINHFP